MAQQTLNSSGETHGTIRTKCNDNFTELYAHSASTSNPHAVTKTQVGLANVDNTADASKPVSSAQQTAIDAAGAFAIVTETTTARTLALSDARKYIRCTNGSAVAVTVPPQSSVVWVAGTEIVIEQSGTGQVTIVAGSGVTLETSLTLKSSARYAAVTLKRTASDTWTVGGERSAS